MNAPTDIVPRFFLIPTDELIPSSTQVQAARRRRFNQQALDELAASIKQSGVLQPILVRPFHEANIVNTAKGTSPGYEIVAGERRFVASRLAGLPQIPAIVRELSDAEVLEAQLVENIQREDLDPLSEAAGYRELMTLKKITADELAELVGKSRSAIFARLKLLQLGPAGREAVENGQLDASRALLVARIPDEKHQAIALKLALERDWRGNPQYSYRDLLAEIGKKGATVSLAGAPFKLTDPTLLHGTAPACMECPHLTANAMTDIPSDSADVCTQPLCYRNKLKAYTKRRTQEAEDQGIEIVKGEEAKKIVPQKGVIVGYIDIDTPCPMDEFPDDEPPYADTEAYKIELAAWQTKADAWKPRTYRELIGSARLPTILLEDPKTKLIRELMSIENARDALKAIGISLPDYAVVIKAPPQPVSPQEREAQHREHIAKAGQEIAFRKQLLKAIFPKALGKITPEEVTAIAIERAEEWQVRAVLEPLYGAKYHAIKRWAPDELGRLLRLSYVAEEADSSYGNPEVLLALAKRYKIDVDAIRKGDIEEQKPTPAKNGTRAKTKPKAAATKAPAKKAKAK